MKKLLSDEDIDVFAIDSQADRFDRFGFGLIGALSTALMCATFKGDLEISDDRRFYC